MTDTKPYNIADLLRTQEEMAEYLIACVQEGADDAAFLRKAVGDVVAAATKLCAPVADSFESWWSAQAAANGGNDIGADYRHWANKAWLASAPVAREAKIYPGDNVAERLDKMADDQPPGSQAQSDLYAAATIWRNSPPHWAAIIDPSLKEIGISITLGDGKIYWVMDVARQKGG